MSLLPALLALTPLLLLLLRASLVLRNAHTLTSLGLAPFDVAPAPPAWKDVVASALLLVPRVGRFARVGAWGPAPYREAVARAASLESFHDELTFSYVGQNRFSDSDHFAENFYFFAQSANATGPATELLVTTRLSFYGKRGRHVVPWFSFYHRGESYNLPAEFEAACEPHETGGDRVARAPGLGELHFELVEPLRRWVLTYRGLVERVPASPSDEKKRVEVKARIELDFSPHDLYVYQLHGDDFAMARSMALKEWTPAFWKHLRSQNQERYASRSHAGSGVVEFLDGSGRVARSAQLQGSRDHNWGIRNWRFIYEYIWWPPVHFDRPLRLDGVDYAYFAGTFVQYGDTFENLVVAGLVADSGDVATVSSATHMNKIAPRWMREPRPGAYKPFGDATIPAKIDFTMTVLGGKYAVDCELERGAGAGMWRQAFWLKDGEFEIHEAQTKFTFRVRLASQPKSAPALAETTAVGLFEFGKNVVGLDDSE